MYVCTSLVPRLPPSLEVWLGSAGSVVQQTVVVRNTVCRKEREGGKSKANKVLLLFVASNLLRYARIKAGEPGTEAMYVQLRMFRLS